VEGDAVTLRYLKRSPLLIYALNSASVMPSLLTSSRSRALYDCAALLAGPLLGRAMHSIHERDAGAFVHFRSLICVPSHDEWPLPARTACLGRDKPRPLPGTFRIRSLYKAITQGAEAPRHTRGAQVTLAHAGAPHRLEGLTDLPKSESQSMCLSWHF